MYNRPSKGAYHELDANGQATFFGWTGQENEGHTEWRVTNLDTGAFEVIPADHRLGMFAEELRRLKNKGVREEDIGGVVVTPEYGILIHLSGCLALPFPSITEHDRLLQFRHVTLYDVRIEGLTVHVTPNATRPITYMSRLGWEPYA